MKQTEQAVFVNRDRCIACGSSDCQELAGGRYHDEPLRGFIERDPWGASPLPHLESASWSYVECRRCGQRFHARILGPEWNERRFSEWMSQEAIEAFEAQHSTPMTAFWRGRKCVEHVLRIETLTRAIRGELPVRVLDFGCGWGDFLLQCRSFGFTAHGVDRSAARRGGSPSTEIFADLDDLEAARDPARAYHAVTAFEVLEHLDNPLSVLRALAALLVPGGIMVLETPDCAGVPGIGSEREYRLIHPLDHINGFTRSTLEALAGRAGLRPVPAPAAYVTTSLRSVAKRCAKRGLRPFLPGTTRIYAVKA